MAASDAIVVGAGIVGAACAWALAREGMSVTVVDAGVVGGGATAAGMGHVVVIDEPPAEFALTLYSRTLWDAQAAELPPRAERAVTGTLWVATDEEEMDAARAKHARLRSAGVEAELLDPRATAEAEPELRQGLAGSLRVPQDSVVYPPPAAAWMLERAGVRGDRLRLGRRVVRLVSGTVELEGGERLSAGVIVNAAGLAARELTPGLPLRARKGHLLITDRYPGFCRHQVVELGYIKNAHGAAKESVAFNVQPRPSGQLLVGSSRQFDEEGLEVESRMLSRVASRAAAFMPRLPDLKVIRAWTGHRAATPDGLPVIGEHPAMRGLWIASGHEGLGITTSLGTAALIADLVTGRTPAIDAAPYSPARFLKPGAGGLNG
jgi:glycine/D-amino acid oxidase-like deaminating enzyme